MKNSRQEFKYVERKKKTFKIFKGLSMKQIKYIFWEVESLILKTKFKFTFKHFRWSITI